MAEVTITIKDNDNKTEGNISITASFSPPIKKGGHGTEAQAFAAVLLMSLKTGLLDALTDEYTNQEANG